MLTPQAIKDQEFQIKFRGYDAIEVKAYLELLAEDFFELTEQNRVQGEEIEALQAEQESLVREKENLSAEVKANQDNADGIQSDIQQGYKHKDEEIAALNEKLASAEKEIDELHKEKADLSSQIKDLEEQLSGSGLKEEEKAEFEKLRARVIVLEEQNKELKQEGVDFKTTILAAQKFADNLKETSETEAAQLMEDARREVETFRTESEAELAYLPKEIEALKAQKGKVKDELRITLQRYMDALDVIPEGGSSEAPDDLSDLFESIEIPEAEDGKDS